MTNIVYIATSIDGYIADKEGKLDWLHEVPNPDNLDCGWSEFMSRIDAIIMGRVTFEAVCSFDCDWPYTKPVFVLSHKLKDIPSKYQDKAEIVRGKPRDLVKLLNQKGYENIYIDGGKTIQSFLNDGLIDEMTVTTVPILLGGGSRLFGDLKSPVKFKLDRTETLLGHLVKNRYVKISQ